MSGPVITETTCTAFRQLPEQFLQDGRVHRFVVGEDTRLRVLTRDEATQELGDPFATGRLLAAYRDLVGPQVQLRDLVVGGVYRRDNVHNSSSRLDRRT